MIFVDLSMTEALSYEERLVPSKGCWTKKGIISAPHFEGKKDEET